MNLTISGHHLEVTPALREYVLTKLDRVTRHFDQVVDINVLLSVEKLKEKERRQKAEVTLRVKGTEPLGDRIVETPEGWLFLTLGERFSRKEQAQRLDNHLGKIVRITKDMSRAIDYLETLNDVDMNKLTFLSPSWGAMMAPMMLVTEPRFKAAVLITGGYSSTPIMPEVEPYQFAPYVKTPILMINGLYDRTFLHELQQIPLKNDLPNVEMKVLKSGHAVPLDETTKLVDEWLRQRFHTSASK